MAPFITIDWLIVCPILQGCKGTEEEQVYQEDRSTPNQGEGSPQGEGSESKPEGRAAGRRKAIDLRNKIYWYLSHLLLFHSFYQAEM